MEFLSKHEHAVLASQRFIDAARDEDVDVAQLGLFPVTRKLGRLRPDLRPLQDHLTSRFNERSIESGEHREYELTLQLEAGGDPDRLHASAADEIMGKHLYVPVDGVKGLGALPELDNRELEFVHERLRTGAVAWYRNPERHEGRHPGALARKYTLDGKDRLFFPDFIFIHNRGGDPYIEIVELHGVEADTQAKRAGLGLWPEDIKRALGLPEERVEAKLLSSYSVFAGRDVDIDYHDSGNLVLSAMREFARSNPDSTDAEVVKGAGSAVDSFFRQSTDTPAVQEKKKLKIVNMARLGSR
jgi:hypothetical protein